MDTEEQLYNHVKRFVEENEIYGGETVWQCDWVIQNACEFIEKCCEIVGYYKDPEDKK